MTLASREAPVRMSSAQTAISVSMAAAVSKCQQVSTSVSMCHDSVAASEIGVSACVLLTSVKVVELKVLVTRVGMCTRLIVYTTWYCLLVDRTAPAHVRRDTRETTARRRCRVRTILASTDTVPSSATVRPHKFNNQYYSFLIRLYSTHLPCTYIAESLSQCGINLISVACFSFRMRLLFRLDERH